MSKKQTSEKKPPAVLRINGTRFARRHNGEKFITYESRVVRGGAYVTLTRREDGKWSAFMDSRFAGRARPAAKSTPEEALASLFVLVREVLEKRRQEAEHALALLGDTAARIEAPPTVDTPPAKKVRKKIEPKAEPVRAKSKKPVAKKATRVDPLA